MAPTRRSSRASQQPSTSSNATTNPVSAQGHTSNGGQGGNRIPRSSRQHVVDLEHRQLRVYLDIAPENIRTFPQPSVFTIVDTFYEPPSPQSAACTCTTTTGNAQGVANLNDLNGPCLHCGHANPTAEDRFVRQVALWPRSQVTARDQFQNPTTSMVSTVAAGASSSSGPLSPSSLSATPAAADNVEDDGRTPNGAAVAYNVRLNTIPDILDMGSYRGGMLPIARRTGPTDREDVAVETDEENYDSSDSDYFDDEDDAYDDDDDLTFEEHLEIGEINGDLPGRLTEEEINERMTRSTYRFTRSKLDWNSIKCCICQAEYSNNDNLGELDCDHRFHYNCIQTWLMLNNSCPICKKIGLGAPNL